MKYLRIENFLNSQENQHLLNWCVNNAQTFVGSGVTTSEEGYRQSRVAYSCPLLNLVTSKVELLVGIVAKALDLEITEISSIESQVTAHGGGDFFKIHTDKGEQHCLQRLISYVYYFHQEPKAFKGGELALYADREKRDRVLITPDNNSLVCFSSMTWHEVLPVVGGGAFHHGRFTVNGWINT